MVIALILNKPEQNPRLKINQSPDFTPTAPAGRILHPSTAAAQRFPGRNSRVRLSSRPAPEPTH